MRAHVADPAAQAATVDRFLDDLDDMAPSSAVDRNRRNGQTALRQQAGARRTVEEFDNVAGGCANPASPRSPTNWPRWSRCSWTEPALEQASGGTERRPARPRSRWSNVCCRARSDDHTLELVRTAVSQRWSAEADLVDGIEHIARLALLKRAEVHDEVDEVEDQLFRFGRVLDAQPRLTCVAERLHHCRRRPNRLAGQGGRR